MTFGYRAESGSCQTLPRDVHQLPAVWLPGQITRLPNPDRTCRPEVPVWQPCRTSAFLFQRPRAGFPPSGFESPQALIPVPTTVQFALARRAYDTPSVAYTGNSNMRLVLCRSNDGSGMNVYLFGCRVVSPDRPAGEITERRLSWFGRRAESAGSQTTLPPSRTMFCLATGSNVGVPVSTTQGGVSPVRFRVSAGLRSRPNGGT